MRQCGRSNISLLRVIRSPGSALLGALQASSADFMLFAGLFVRAQDHGLEADGGVNETSPRPTSQG